MDGQSFGHNQSNFLLTYTKPPPLNKNYWTFLEVCDENEE